MTEDEGNGSTAAEQPHEKKQPNHEEQKKAAAKPKRGKPFQKGNSGRPLGARNKRTVLLESILDGQAENLAAKLLELALAGDQALLKLCIDRLYGRTSGRTINLRLPKIKSEGDAAEALAAVVAAVAAGEVTPEEGVQLSQLISAASRAFAEKWEVLK